MTVVWPAQLSSKAATPLVEEQTGAPAAGVKRSKGEAAALASRLRASQFGPAEWSSALQSEVLGRYEGGESGERIAPASAALTIAIAQASWSCRRLSRRLLRKRVSLARGTGHAI